MIFKRFDYMKKYFNLKRLVKKWINKVAEYEDLMESIEEYCSNYGIDVDTAKFVQNYNPFLYWCGTKTEELKKEIEELEKEVKDIVNY